MIPLVVDPGYLAAFVTGGIGTMAWAVVQVYRAVKNGAATDEQDEYARLEHDAAYEALRRAHAETERDYWHRRSASMEYELTRNAGAETTQRIIAVVGNPPVLPPLPEPPTITPHVHETYAEMMARLNAPSPRRSRTDHQEETR